VPPQWVSAVVEKMNTDMGRQRWHKLTPVTVIAWTSEAKTADPESIGGD
jgi:hypothetical protein